MRRLVRRFVQRIKNGDQDPTEARAPAPLPSPGPDISTPSDTSNTDLFQYQPLSSSSSFRILHLRRELADGGSGGYRDLPLYGSLLEASFTNHPNYFALSYCWGDPTLNDEINIDGRVLHITASCGSALRRMLRGKMERLIWVDSICINQATSSEALAERGRQVAVMDEIYRNAEQVNVNLGEGDEASDAACEALKSLVQPYLGAKMPGPQQEDSRRQYEALADEILKSTPEYPYGKLHGVFRLPWFRRCWVIQEVALGRKVFFYCGKHLMHMKTVVIGADFTRLPYSKAYSETMAFHWKSYIDYHDALNEFIRRKDEGEPISNSGLTLSTVLLLPALSFEATRPEDKIYALYGLCKRFGFQVETPDYQKSVAVVYREAASAIINCEQGLNILHIVTESSGWETLDLPSWVPNFSGCLRNWSPSNPPHMCVGAAEDPRVSGNSCYEYFLEPGASRLMAKGRRLGVVLASGLPCMTDNSTSLIGDPSKPSVQYVGALLESIGTWYDISTRIYPDTDGTMAMQAMVRTLILARHSAKAPGQTLMTFDDLFNHLSVLVNVSKGRRNKEAYYQPLILKAPGDNVTEVFAGGEFLVSANMQRAILQIFNMSWKTLLHVAGDWSSDGNRLAIGTYTVRPDDQVVVLSGSPTAAVLRPFQDGFRYIGPASVYGVTDGEFWAAGTETDDEWFTLI